MGGRPDKGSSGERVLERPSTGDMARRPDGSVGRQVSPTRLRGVGGPVTLARAAGLPTGGHGSSERAVRPASYLAANTETG